MGINGIFIVYLHTNYKIITMNFIGVYECKVDAKHRLLLPCELKKQLEYILHERFVLKRSIFQPCLELYPMNQWNEMMDKINNLNRFIKRNNDFIRRFVAGVKPLEIDKTGRILIAKDLSKYAHIQKDVVISSSINMIEIWDKNNYENTINHSVNNFSELAEQIMGNANE